MDYFGAYRQWNKNLGNQTLTIFKSGTVSAFSLVLCVFALGLVSCVAEVQRIIAHRTQVIAQWSSSSIPPPNTPSIQTLAPTFTRTPTLTPFSTLTPTKTPVPTATSKPSPTMQPTLSIGQGWGEGNIHTYQGNGGGWDPIVNATIRFTCSKPDPNFESNLNAGVTITSDPKGDFSFKDLPRCLYTVSVSGIPSELQLAKDSSFGIHSGAKIFLDLTLVKPIRITNPVNEKGFFVSATVPLSNGTIMISCEPLENADYGHFITVYEATTGRRVNYTGTFRPQPQCQTAWLKLESGKTYRVEIQARGKRWDGKFVTIAESEMELIIK